MTDQAKTQQPTQQQLIDALPLPTNRGELRTLIASTVAEVLAVPDNANLFAQLLHGASVTALQAQNKIAKLQSAKAVLSRIEYQGGARATIFSKSADGSDLGVTLEERKGDDWVPLVREQWVIDGMTTLALSQPTYAGDVWYITTSARVDELQESLVDQIIASNPSTAAPAV